MRKLLFWGLILSQYSSFVFADQLKLKLPTNPECANLIADVDAIDINGCIAIEKNDYTQIASNKPDFDALKKYKQNHEDIKFLTYHHTALAKYKTENDKEIVDVERTKRLIANRPKKMGIGRQVINIQAGHIKKYTPIFKKSGPKEKWGDIAYHYVVDRYGSIVEGRPLPFHPASGTIYKGSAKGHFTVVIIGNYDHEPLTEKGLLALTRVLSAGQRKFRVPSKNINGHKHHAQTSCPGEYIYKRRSEIRERTLAYSIQSELKERGCYSGKLDGWFGKNSKRALKLLKSKYPSWSIAGADDGTLWQLLDLPSRKCP